MYKFLLFQAGLLLFRVLSLTYHTTDHTNNTRNIVRDVICFVITWLLKAVFPQAVYCWGSILPRKKELATLTGRAPELCGWALWPGSVSGPCSPLVLLLSLSWPRPELCVRVLSSSCPCLGCAPELCGWSLWPGLLERSVAEQIAMSMPTKIIDEAVCSRGGR